MRQELDGKEEELGLHIEKRRSRRQHPIIITDTDFSDDIALISELISQAQEMIIRVVRVDMCCSVLCIVCCFCPCVIYISFY